MLLRSLLLSTLLSSKRLLNVAEVYHEKFVEKKAIGTRQEKERKNIIEIDEGF